MDPRELKRLKMEQTLANAQKIAEMKQATETKDKIESMSPFVFERKIRPDKKKIYGSVTPTTIAEEITLKTGNPIRVASITMDKVQEIGMFTGSVELISGDND